MEADYSFGEKRHHKRKHHKEYVKGIVDNEKPAL